MTKKGQGTYGAIFRTKAAYRFDVGTLLMRLFAYTTTIGTITTLTLAGASAFEASSVASLIAVCMFFVAPRVSRRIDERGQGAVVPKAALVAMAGLALMLATTHFGWPFWLNYLAAPLVSFLPNAQALARARWTYLVSSGKLGKRCPSAENRLRVRPVGGFRPGCGVRIGRHRSCPLLHPRAAQAPVIMAPRFSQLVYSGY